MKPIESNVHNGLLNAYGCRELAPKLIQSLIACGIKMEQLTTDDLLSFDELHIMGRKATIELGRWAELSPMIHVLEIGSGLGGPARTLAQHYGCRVVGVDLSPDYVEAAGELTTRVGLGHLVRFECADALALPFEAQTFDAVALIHVSMNIADKAALFGECRRVLKPGGKLALWEVCRGEAAELIYPVPWANDAAFSHLLPMAEMIAAVKHSGFAGVRSEDATAEAARWVGERTESAGRKGHARPSPDLDLILPDFRLKRANISKNLMQGAIRLLRATATNP
jgi:ubiquinone/menaquinone biosynthesis C-methylase UbiE